MFLATWSKYGKEVAPPMPASSSKPDRLLYIDNIRWLMIVLVIMIHANVIYAPVGDFFGYEDRSEDLGVSEMVQTIISVLTQAFFMGLLFLIAGYFVPNSLAKKGEKKFIRDRFVRLGVPTLIFMLFVAPTILYPLYYHGTDSFATFALDYYPDPVNWDSGPMWFAVALLIFSIIWAFKPSGLTFDRIKGPLTRTRVAILIALVVVVTFLVRIPFPLGTDVWNMQLCFFTQYAALFIVGIIAYKNNWLATIPAKDGKLYLIVSVASIFIIMFPIMILGGAVDGELDSYNGGLAWQAFGLTLFEQIFGICFGLFIIVWFRERHNRQGRLTKKISDNAFAVYVFHPPVVIALAVLLSSYDWPRFLKFIMLFVSATLITFTLAEFVFRRIPLLKKVL
jgi:glucan biosynthesis protein C